ncbi:MAG: helix-hairpin-helix domain-containing protein [Patescibacteria group bacterium]
MEGFVLSVLPFLRKYAVESILLSAALILTTISIAIYTSGTAQNVQNIALHSQTSEKKTDSPYEKPGRITVQVSGAVKKPGVFKIQLGSRLTDAITRAQGLSQEADQTFFSRNFNLARFLVDQEKIYVPSVFEVDNGIFVGRTLSIDYLSPQASPDSNTVASTDKVHINTASSDELMALPGIGEATAAKIMQNRPYATVDDLSTKKIINKNVYSAVKEFIEL